MRPMRAELFLLVMAGGVVARAATTPSVAPLARLEQESTLIVVGKITTFLSAAVATRPTDPLVIRDPQTLSDTLEFQPAGTYHIAVVRVLKGECGNEVVARLAPLSAVYYGREEIKLDVGSPVLLFLRKDKGGYAGINAYRPLIPLAAAALNAPPAGRKNDMVEALVTSLDDASVRRIVLGALSDTVDQRVVAAVRPYADDKDLRTQELAIEVLAANQDVTAIPKLAALLMANNDSGPSTAFRRYTTPAAVPFLNKVIVEGTNDARVNAAAALRRLADASSIPFLVAALDHDDTQHQVTTDAYFTLHRLVPELGIADAAAIDSYRATEIGMIKAWWAKKQAAAPATATAPSR